jgi:hypothetical protein
VHRAPRAHQECEWKCGVQELSRQISERGAVATSTLDNQSLLMEVVRRRDDRRGSILHLAAREAKLCLNDPQGQGDTILLADTLC